MLQELAQAGLMQGLVLSLVALGVMIPFKILNFPDLSCDGAYPLGGAITASLLLSGISPLLATTLAMILGGILGLATAMIHLRFKVNTLLAGILVCTMIYSVNLRIMHKPNLALFDYQTLFTFLQDNLILTASVLLVLCLSVILLLYRFLISEKGLRLRAVGLNPGFAMRQGIPLAPYIFLGLFLANALNGLAGSLMVQLQHYADIGMGVGMVIHALAALMIGESLIGTQTLRRQLLAPFVGALIYQQIQGIAMSLGLAPTDLKLMTGAIVLVAIGLKLKNKRAHV
ncbi:MAG: ABC transporter permease [Proteobacteria bacterium]|nr:ABC transporter permease [Pseudomonadota bacterium]